MKKIYYILCMLVTFGLAVFSLSSCTNEQEDLFTDSSENRVDAGISEINSILVGADKGWRMEYFLDGLLTYGGYNTLLKFNENGTVDAASEMFESDFIATSLYSINQSAGVVVSIDTYNEVFSAFSDPGAPLLGSTGDGMGGDNDFLVISATKEKILLKGKKSGVVVSLTPMTQEWTIFLDGISAAKSSMYSQLYEIKIGEHIVDVNQSNNTLSISYMVNEVSRTVSAPYIVDAGSYTFYEPITVLGATLSGFNYVEATDSFTAIDDVAITMVKVIPPINEQFISGDWFIAFSDLGPFAKPYFSYAKDNGIDPFGEVLEFAFMGSMFTGNFGFNFQCSGYRGALYYDYSLKDDDQITLDFALQGDGNGVFYYQNLYFSYMLIPFGHPKPVTFTLTTDNLAAPSYILLTDNSNPDNWMKLHKQQIAYPFEN